MLITCLKQKYTLHTHTLLFGHWKMLKRSSFEMSAYLKESCWIQKTPSHCRHILYLEVFVFRKILTSECCTYYISMHLSSLWKERENTALLTGGSHAGCRLIYINPFLYEILTVGVIIIKMTIIMITIKLFSK